MWSSFHGQVQGPDGKASYSQHTILSQDFHKQTKRIFTDTEDLFNDQDPSK